MRRVLLLIAALSAVVAATAVAQPARHDARSAELVARLERAVGAERFARWGGLAWTFEVSRGDTVRTARQHEWDRRRGWHRVAYTDRAGKRIVLAHALGDTVTCRAWVDGQPLTGDTLRTLARRAELLWGHDTYWFLMPFKLRDDRVQLAWQKSHEVDGRPADRVELTFAGGGDTYAIDLDRGHHRVAHWEFHHEGDTHIESGTWDGWAEVDGVWFATEHLREDGRTRIRIKDLARRDILPPARFEAP